MEGICIKECKHESSIDDITKIYNVSKNIQDSSSQYINYHPLPNGLYDKTVLIRENNDTFVFFDCEILIIDPSDLQSLWEYYNEYIHKANIVIDSRLCYLIFYAIIKYGDNILIYDPYVIKIKTVYNFCSDYFKIQNNELNIYQYSILLIVKLIISFFMSSLDIKWNVNDVIKQIKSHHNYEIIDILLQYVGLQKPTNKSMKNVDAIIKYFQSYFSASTLDINDAPILTKWNIPNTNIYELVMAFTMLKNSNFNFFT